MNNAMGILGLAARARKIATGETVMKQLRSGKVKLVILSKDMGILGKRNCWINAVSTMFHMYLWNVTK